MPDRFSKFGKSADEFGDDQMGDHAGFVPAAEQQPHGFAAPDTKINRPVVDVHTDETVCFGSIEVSAVLHGVPERGLAMIEAVLDAALEQCGDFEHGFVAEISANGVATQRQGKSAGFVIPPLSKIHDQVQPWLA